MLCKKKGWKYPKEIGTNICCLMTESRSDIHYPVPPQPFLTDVCLNHLSWRWRFTPSLCFRSEPRTCSVWSAAAEPWHGAEQAAEGIVAWAVRLDLLTSFKPKGVWGKLAFGCSKPVQQLFTFQAINIITIMLRSNFGKFCSEPLWLRWDSFSRDLSFWWKPNCSFGFV